MAREEAGTPAIVESIRAGLVFALKEAAGTGLIQAREERFWRARARWDANPAIELLGSPAARRLPIVSFRVRHHGRFLHHNFVVALLNDLFGIQAHGGCSCAGPHGHRLPGIDTAPSLAPCDQLTDGWKGIKPGWTRVDFNYFISDPVCDYIIDAVDLIASYGQQLLADYHVNPGTGRGGTTPEPPNHRSASPMCASGPPGRWSPAPAVRPARTCSIRTFWTPGTC